MGLSAAVGALPHPYTEFLLERIRAKTMLPVSSSISLITESFHLFLPGLAEITGFRGL